MGGYIFNYASANTPVIDITGTSMQLLINFRDKNANAPSDHAPGSVGVPTFGLLAIELRIPLSELFDQLWGVTKDNHGQTMQQRAVAQVIQDVQGQGSSNVSGSFPSTGALRALAFPKGPVFLSYWLADASFTFNKGPLGAQWNLTFDTELFINLDTQNWPTISPKASVHVMNANISGANFGASVDETVQTVGNFLTSQPLAIFQAQEGSVDSSAAAPPDLSALTTFFTMLASAAIPLGFRTLSAFVDSGAKTLTLRLIHAVDPAPVLWTDMSYDGPILAIPPVIGTTQWQIKPGEQFGVLGNNFPRDRASQISVYWYDASSGAPSESDIEWGPIHGPTKTEQQSPQGYEPSFSATGLSPATTYKFRVRDCDQLTCSDWSSWLSVVTQADRPVTLLLDYNGTSHVVGNASLGDGAFSATITVPAQAPTGSLKLWAAVAGSELASTTITVLPANQAPKPMIEIIDLDTNAVLQTPQMEAGWTCSVRGEGFSPGSITLCIDSPGGQQLSTATVPANGIFVSSFMWPTGVVGNHSIVACYGQSVDATTTVMGEEVPILQ